MGPVNVNSTFVTTELFVRYIYIYKKAFHPAVFQQMAFPQLVHVLCWTLPVCKV